MKLLAGLIFAALLAAQTAPTTADQAPKRDTSYIDADGTAHVTRVVPVPDTISPEVQKRLRRQEPDQGPPVSLADRRKGPTPTRRGRAWSGASCVRIDLWKR